MASRAPGLPAFLGSDKFSDITVKFGGREFKAHKVILAAKSGWFRGAFDSGFKEASASVIELYDDDPEALEFALQFLYQDEPSMVLEEQQPTSGDAIRRHLTLYELSNKYDIPSLAKATATILLDLFKCDGTIIIDAKIARMLYTGISHDDHGLKQGYFEALRSQICVLNKEMQQFARDNHEFAVDILFRIWSACDVFSCNHCDFDMAIKFPCDDNGEQYLDWVPPICPKCGGRLGYF